MKTIERTKIQLKTTKSKKQNIDYKVVEQFKKGLKDLKKGKIIEC